VKTELLAERTRRDAGLAAGLAKGRHVRQHIVMRIIAFLHEQFVIHRADKMVRQKSA